jgi:hypothetical protein
MRLRAVIVVALVALACSMRVAAQLSSTPAELAWVGLFNGDLILVQRGRSRRAAAR